MLKGLLVLLLALCLIGCNEKPYREEAKPQEAEYSFNGITENWNTNFRSHCLSLQIFQAYSRRKDQRSHYCARWQF